MRQPGPDPAENAIAIAPLPRWIVAGSAETLADAAFRSGAALAHLHGVAAQSFIPHALWRDRLALAAAEVCVGFTGRRENQAALRDAVHLTRAGDDPGPAGGVFALWSRAVARPITLAHLERTLASLPAGQIALCLAATEGTPVDRAAYVIEAVLTDLPRAEAAALVLADAVLGAAMGWDHILPVLAVALKLRDLRLRGDDLQLACHRAILAGAKQAVPLAADLARRAAGLRAVAPKLRAKAADRAVEMFLSRDAIAPSSLATFMSDRAARRLSDRLVELGVVRELTGRDTFRLYGV